MPRNIHRRLPDPTDHDMPLNVEEQELLDEFLEGEGGGELTGFVQLDGFMTAVVAVAGTQMPARWHQLILGGATEEEALTRLLAAESRGILALLLRQWRTVRRRELATDRWELPGDGEESCHREADWANGFLRAINRTQVEWEGRMSHRRRDKPLEALIRIAELPLDWGSEAEPEALPALSEEEHAELGAELVMAAGEFYRGVRGRGRG